MSGALSWLVWTAAVNAGLATLACVAVAALARVTARPALVHWMWLVVLARLLMPPVVPLPVVPVTASIERAVVEAPAAGLPAAAPVAEPLVPPRAARLALPVFVAFPWAIGSLVIWWSAARRRRRMTRLLRRAAPAAGELRALAERLARDLGLPRCPPLLIVAARLSPMVWCAPRGLCVVLPAALLDRLPADGVEAVLAHELVHVRRRDHWTRRFELAATILCWWAPPLWWARAGLRRAEERCCDLRVVGLRPRLAAAYARALVETAAFVNETKSRHGRLPALASGAAPVRQLEERLTMIMRDDRRPTDSPSSPLLRLALLCAAIVALAVAPAAIEATAGEPAARDALSREADALNVEIDALHAQIAELAAERRALALEVERLESRLERPAPAAAALDRRRAFAPPPAPGAPPAPAPARAERDAERARLEAELFELRDRGRDRRLARELRDESREMSRARARDTRELARLARERASAPRAEFDARDAMTDSVERLREVRALLEERILELEAEGRDAEAERLRRKIESTDGAP